MNSSSPSKCSLHDTNNPLSCATNDNNNLNITPETNSQNKVNNEPYRIQDMVELYYHYYVMA